MNPECLVPYQLISQLLRNKFHLRFFPFNTLKIQNLVIILVLSLNTLVFLFFIFTVLTAAVCGLLLYIVCTKYLNCWKILIVKCFTRNYLKELKIHFKKSYGMVSFVIFFIIIIFFHLYFIILKLCLTTHLDK